VNSSPTLSRLSSPGPAAQPGTGPLKIGIVTHYMPPHKGGIEGVAEALFRAYRQRGHEVRWVASRSPANLPKREGDRIRVPCLNFAEERLGVPIPLWGSSGMREVSGLSRWADVLHVHDCLYPGSALAVRTRCPVVLTQHVGLVKYRLGLLNTIQRTAYRTLGRSVLARSAAVVCATPSAEEFVPGLIGRRGIAIPNGIDTEGFRPATWEQRSEVRRRLGLPQDGPVALFVGRLVEKKGVPLLVEAIRALPRVHFLVVGDGPMADSLPWSGNVTRLAAVDPVRMPDCYAAADFLFLPSQGEGMPLSVQEALACGLPAIVSADEAFAQRLAAEELCIPVPRTPEGVIEGVRAAAAHEVKHSRFAARTYAAQHWSLDAMAEAYETLLRKVVSEWAGRRALG
jgi:glycosyltransferase involved in cell wall biosynthesis